MTQRSRPPQRPYLVLALGAHEKPSRCKSLRTKGVAASDVGLERFPTNHWAEEKRAALSAWGVQ